MILAFLIVVPCCLVGLVVYALMSKWQLSSEPEPWSRGGSSPSRPRLTMRETVLDWPVPQFQRLHPSVLIGISVVLALWILAWIVVFFVGLGLLHA
jgi:hypothetical protein